MGTLLLTIPVTTVDGQGLSLIDALFTATSAVCVTGLVVVDTGTTFTPLGQMIILTLIELGGLGFMTFATWFALLRGRKIFLSERLLLQESLNQTSVQGMVRLARHILLLTLGFQLTGAMVFAWQWAGTLGGPKALYYGLFHSVSAFNNAGFDLMGDFRSFTGMTTDWTISLTLAALFILGGLGFSVLLELGRRRPWRAVTLHTKIVVLTTGFLLAVGTLAVLVLEGGNHQTLGTLPWQDRLLAAFFQSATARTAGFNTLDTGALFEATQFVVILLMFVGASPGSTGGGIKTSTFSTLIIAVWSLLRGHPQPVALGRQIGWPNVQRALAVTTIALFWVVGASILLAALERSPFIPTLFETTSAFATVGLSTGMTPDLTTPGKLLIALTMFFGRLGPLTLAFALGRGRGDARPNINYPEERIMIG